MTKYKSANIWLGLTYFLFSPSRYLLLARNHSIAIILDDPSSKKEFDEDKNGTIIGNISDTVKKRRDQLYSGFFRSLFSILCVVTFSLAIAYFFGWINFSFTLSINKILQLSGTTIIMWSALYKLGWGLRTIGGVAFHELVFELLFKIKFIVGSTLALISILIS